METILNMDVHNDLHILPTSSEVELMETKLEISTEIFNPEILPTSSEVELMETLTLGGAHSTSTPLPTSSEVELMETSTAAAAQSAADHPSNFFGS